jgi:alkanesulfonate monooxygenase SsuD/methylene tetrahydromethanopterin reductase-like flavin-dependent oxidoreductase (luciferase family)
MLAIVPHSTADAASEAYREAWNNGGHRREPRVSISRSIFAVVDDCDRAYFGQQWIGLSTGTARVLTRLAPTKWWGETTLVTCLQDHDEHERVARNEHE